MPEDKENVDDGRKQYNKKIHYSKNVFASYWHQIDEIVKKSPEKILEVGVAYGAFVSNYLKERKFDVTTIDIYEELKPDIIGNVLNIPFEENSYDLIGCFEVLEHLPIKDLNKALEELHRVSSKWVIISLPDQTKYIKYSFNAPIIGSGEKIISLNFLNRPVPVFKEHYWEIGSSKSTSLKNIRILLMKHNFIIFKTFRVYEFPYHRFFILKIK